MRRQLSAQVLETLHLHLQNVVLPISFVSPQILLSTFTEYFHVNICKCYRQHVCAYFDKDFLASFHPLLQVLCIRTIYRLFVTCDYVDSTLLSMDYCSVFLNFFVKFLVIFLDFFVTCDYVEYGLLQCVLPRPSPYPAGR